tara:strand:+ start:16096 stop:16689 length:594 start_codon:yes stop_codon:yes gene_type:complete
MEIEISMDSIIPQINNGYLKEAEMFEEFLKKNSNIQVSANWDHYHELLEQNILEALHKFKSIRKIWGFHLPLPKEGFKGVYFCLGDDGTHLSIDGSIYCSEKDWAANADYYAKDLDVFNILFHLMNEIEVKETEEINANKILFMFLVFVICKTLSQSRNIKGLINTSIVIGYSAGEMLMLGEYCNKVFNQNIKLLGY